jgi:predicted ribosome quality control (RQC) complex YloA/Tae2 family protein
MTYQFSSVDIHHVLFEFSALIGAKVDQIYQYSEADFVFRFHKSGVGKLEVRILIPFSLFLTQSRPEPTTQFNFCTYLRKHYKGTYLEEVSQIGFNRAVKLTFGFKDSKRYLFLEFFDKGNIIASADGVLIDNCVSQQRWKDRIVRPGQNYVLEDTPFPADALLTAPPDMTVSKVLATHCRLGGFYAKLVCQMAHIDADADFSDEHIIALTNSLTMLFAKQKFTLLDEKIVPICVTGKDVAGVVDVHMKTFDTMSEYVTTLFTGELVVGKSANAALKKTKAVSKHEKIIRAQQGQLTKVEKEIVENNETAKLLQSVQLRVDEILRDYAKGKLHSCIVFENKKDKTITIDVNKLYDD